MSPTETERAWAAGLFDGEGWASAAIYSRKTGGMTSTPSLGVGQAEPELLDRFARIVGVGSVNGPYGRAAMFQFKACGVDRVQMIADLLWPYLGTRKRVQLTRVLDDAHVYRRTHPSRLFAVADVRKIRERLAAGEKQAAIALSLGVPKSTINAIARGRTYREIGLLTTDVSQGMA